MKEITIETVLETMRNHILKDDDIPPARWIEAALRLNVLSEDIDNTLAGLEANMAEDMAKKVADNMSAAKAKILRVDAIDYKYYLQLKAQRTRIDEYIMLAKKRAVVQNI